MRCLWCRYSAVELSILPNRLYIFAVQLLLLYFLWHVEVMSFFPFPFSDMLPIAAFRCAWWWVDLFAKHQAISLAAMMVQWFLDEFNDRSICGWMDRLRLFICVLKDILGMFANLKESNVCLHALCPILECKAGWAFGQAFPLPFNLPLFSPIWLDCKQWSRFESLTYPSDMALLFFLYYSRKSSALFA